MISNQQMHDRLKTEICEVTFEKVDGTERTMICTLKDDFLPHVPVNQIHTEREHTDYMPVFDLEVRGWRAFKPSKVIRFESSPE